MSNKSLPYQIDIITIPMCVKSVTQPYTTIIALRNSKLCSNYYVCINIMEY